MWEARDFSVSDINRLRKLLHSETLNELLDRGYAYNVFSWRIIRLYKEAWYAMLAKLGYHHDYTFHDFASRMINDHERHYGIVPSIVEINDAIEYPARRDERRIERDIEREILDELGSYNIEPRRGRDRERRRYVYNYRREHHGMLPPEEDEIRRQRGREREIEEQRQRRRIEIERDAENERQRLRNRNIRNRSVQEIEDDIRREREIEREREIYK
jgi:hypothetical protein